LGSGQLSTAELAAVTAIPLTTANKNALEDLVGPTDTLQIIGKPADLNTLLACIEAAVLRD